MLGEPFFVLGRQSPDKGPQWISPGDSKAAQEGGELCFPVTAARRAILSKRVPPCKNALSPSYTLRISL